MTDKKEVKLNFFIKLLLRLWPKQAMKILAKKQGIKEPIFDKLHEVFHNSNRVDIFRVAGNERGFILIIDRQTALYFYQNNDHFEYDGFEMGQYDKGDVTIFDRAFYRNPIPKD